MGVQYFHYYGFSYLKPISYIEEFNNETTENAKLKALFDDKVLLVGVKESLSFLLIHSDLIGVFNSKEFKDVEYRRV